MVISTGQYLIYRTSVDDMLAHFYFLFQSAALTWLFRFVIFSCLQSASCTQEVGSSSLVDAGVEVELYACAYTIDREAGISDWELTCR
ncbi:hypothetical protein H257_03229 [Aphanomyces astaci]|uniref:Uncharacterized protein n=1 Tax=Aphanomyces astaci TaxID=112090 RepID=W4H0S6_APHAT|nr:hypothetical protein H257_03229 [Aphanomyces astaci]ETV85507.1 hypothetical protein H257_03229 [Aphanomyces astaci]|eukprot:XP_009825525.1 hypothetical protein H257_03229 [Aphanomyces astaci]